MTEAPQFRVFLKDGSYPKKLLQLFPDGIPCDGFYALDRDKIVPENFIFRVEHPSCSFEQADKAFQFFDCDTEETYLTDEDCPLIIPASRVSKVIDSYGNTPSLELMKQAWTLTNHASRLDNLEIKLNGEVGHVVLMGLQQALFVDPSSGVSLNPMLFELSIHLINELSQGNEILKEYFTTGFPCEYINQAKALLFPE